MTPAQIEATIALVTSAVDIALPAMGQPELVPIANALGALTSKIVEAYAAKAAAQDPIPAEIAAADAAARAALAAKFPPK